VTFHRLPIAIEWGTWVLAENVTVLFIYRRRNTQHNARNLIKKTMKN